jgi:ribosomal protein S14
MWRRAVAPFAEWIARTLSHTISKPNRLIGPPTRLTQGHGRDARVPATVLIKNPRPQETFCQGCGKPIPPGRKNCVSCAIPVSRENFREVAREGRLAAQSSEAQARRSASKRRHDAARSGWLPSSLPGWLNDETCTNKILPALARGTVPAIASAIGVSMPYASYPLGQTSSASSALESVSAVVGSHHLTLLASQIKVHRLRLLRCSC